MSEKSDCIGFTKMMADYFNFVNKQGTTATDETFSRCDHFCKEFDINAKVMKEAHFLCIQLQKIAKDDILESQQETFDFISTADFKHPTR